jgi:hypothetical protein
MNNRHESRFSNLLYGAFAGCICACLIFGTTYAINGGRPPLAFDTQTAKGFIEFVHWGWFGGIVGFFALVGFIFNTRLVYTLSDVADWFH